ncbi:hypothetical protein ARC78_06035 [Stenotrophomonas pictorum JCM 9942]|jgi:uncharacterized low-complexity protein|uniref:Low-complexity protein n=1 Tax=Stenotrophomonas pictorum JCM 9942 TaxID=1236960 RepID=A0A0R0AUW7_9GAMM|nr:hypothetical protein [Stenotrophomonas pictorum]KRG44115.1 hypothetical protein ARC78_06035 [Stenotrophomonas pictorum JCM 9942]
MAIDIRKSTSLALGAALLGSLGAAPAFAMTDLAQGYALGATAQTPPTAGQQATAETAKTEDAKAKHTAEGKCGEGKCGASKDKNTDADAKAADKAAGAAKAHAEGKCGEGKCGGSH